MKAATIAFAAIIALSSAAFAGDKDARPAKPNQSSAQQEQVLDTNTTGSIVSSDKDTTAKPRVGMQLSPFSFGSFH